MKRKNLSIVTLFLSALLLSSGCAQQKNLTSVKQGVTEIRKGVLSGYLAPNEYPNSLELLPPPPEEGSTEYKLDQEKAAYYVALKDEKRKALAVQDADLSFPNALKAYNGVLPVKITEQTTPNTYILMRRILTDAGRSVSKAKNYYQRKRPFMVNNTPTLTPDYEEALRANGSYPSGHTTIGWAWALVLTEIFPSQADAILQRGFDFGTSRNVCNVHWYSDVKAGRIMGAAVVARLHANKQFLIDLEAAKKEIASASKQ